MIFHDVIVKSAKLCLKTYKSIFVLTAFILTLSEIATHIGTDLPILYLRHPIIGSFAYLTLSILGYIVTLQFLLCSAQCHSEGLLGIMRQQRGTVIEFCKASMYVMVQMWWWILFLVITYFAFPISLFLFGNTNDFKMVGILLALGIVSALLTLLRLHRVIFVPLGTIIGITASEAKERIPEQCKKYWGEFWGYLLLLILLSFIARLVFVPTITLTALLVPSYIYKTIIIAFYVLNYAFFTYAYYSFGTNLFERHINLQPSLTITRTTKLHIDKSKIRNAIHSVMKPAYRQLYLYVVYIGGLFYTLSYLGKYMSAQPECTARMVLYPLGIFRKYQNNFGSCEGKYIAHPSLYPVFVCILASIVVMILWTIILSIRTYRKKSEPQEKKPVVHTGKLKWLFAKIVLLACVGFTGFLYLIPPEKICYLSNQSYGYLNPFNIHRSSPTQIILPSCWRPRFHHYTYFATDVTVLYACTLGIIAYYQRKKR